MGLRLFRTIGMVVESIQWQVYGFDRYLNGNAGAVPPDAVGKKTSN